MTGPSDATGAQSLDGQDGGAELPPGSNSRDDCSCRVAAARDTGSRPALWFCLAVLAPGLVRRRR